MTFYLVASVDNIPQAAKISSPRDARMVQMKPFAVRKSRNFTMFSLVDARSLLFGIT